LLLCRRVAGNLLGESDGQSAEHPSGEWLDVKLFRQPFHFVVSLRDALVVIITPANGDRLELLQGGHVFAAGEHLLGNRVQFRGHLLGKLQVPLVVGRIDQHLIDKSSHKRPVLLFNGRRQARCQIGHFRCVRLDSGKERLCVLVDKSGRHRLEQPDHFRVIAVVKLNLRAGQRLLCRRGGPIPHYLDLGNRFLGMLSCFPEAIVFQRRQLLQ
jgi:hypothetical protein